LEQNPDSLHQYYVHVARPITNEQKSQIERAIGTNLGVYVPHNTFLLVATAEQAERARNAPGVHWVGAVQPEHKYPVQFPDLLDESSSLLIHLVPEVPEHAKRTEAEVQDIASSWKRNLKGQVKAVQVLSKDKILFRMGKNEANTLKVVDWVASRPESHWIEPTLKHSIHNYNVTRIIQSNNQFGTPFTDLAIDGTGEVIALADTGLAYDSCFFVDNATALKADVLNFAARKVIKYVTTYGDFVDAEGHGTHVAGTILGTSQKEMDNSPVYNKLLQEPDSSSSIFQDPMD